MKIKEIAIENFRSIGEEDITFPANGILALVGPNNAGKSNILKAIDNILGDLWFSGDRAELNDYFMKNKNNEIKIEIVFNDGKKVVFESREKWATYYDEGENRMPYGSNIKEDFPCTYLSANRDLAKNMQFRSYEIMGKIAKKFNERIEDTTKRSLEQKFNDIMSELDDVEGFRDFQDDFCNYFNDLQSDSPYKLKVSFKAFSPLNYFKTINILANDSSVNSDFDIDPIELGEGNKSLMLFALIRSYAKNLKQGATGILAVEEPEIYLHPQARRHLYKIFKEIVSDSNIQIIYTTHSPDFICTEDFSSIGLVSKDPENGTKITTVTEQELVNFSIESGVPENKTSVDNIKDFYATTSDFKLNEGFFAKHLILVEGDTEELCLPLLFERLGLNYFSSGISVIGVEGKNQIPKYWRLFKSFDIKISIIFDSDSEGNKNLATCFACEEEEISQDIEIIKKISTEQQNLYIFENDFETALKKSFNDDEKWNEYLQEAIQLINPIMRNGRPDQQKGQIARYVVNRILKENQDYRPDFLNDLLSDVTSN
jgi:putative ATP-dependent endonuclease of the OLD family